tara:strand:- start:260 stop:775 length:516 start_codon:yes stop_codon:yes gene_type:complete
MLSQNQQQLLQNERAILELNQRESRFIYYGIYESYCANKPNIQRLNYTKLNPKQHFLFKRVLHGLNMYSKEQVAEMHPQKKRRISKVWRKGQNLINEWKQMICNKRINKFLFITFGDKSPLMKELLAVPVNETDPNYKNTHSLKDLNITYEDLILKFMQSGLLPKNFLVVK